jgi:dolichol-phosphate mannosyltransferase
VKKLTVVIPTLNEAENLPGLIDKLFSLDLPDTRLSILVIDDGSIDGTGDIVERRALAKEGRLTVMHRAGEKSFGGAYLEGFSRALESGADLIAQMDGDWSHDPWYLTDMVPKTCDSDLVVGSRYIGGGMVDTEWHNGRKLVSWVANRLVIPTLTGIPVRDATGGYRLWTRGALAGVMENGVKVSPGFGIQVRLLDCACKLGFRVVEVPIHFTERRSGHSKFSFHDKLRTIRDVLSLAGRSRLR